MNETDPPKAETQDGLAGATERKENAMKAQEMADRLFPGHKWRKVEDGIPIPAQANREEFGLCGRAL